MSASAVPLAWIAGLAYLGLVGVLTWWARRGQPVTEPDALTLGVLAAGLLVAGGATAAILLGGRPSGRPAAA